MPQKDKQFWCKCGYGPDDKKGINSHVYTLCTTEKGKHGRVNKQPAQLSAPAPAPAVTPAPSPAQASAPTPAKERTRAVRVWNISWWKILLGLACCAVGIFGIAMYAGTMNMFMGMVAVVGLVPGVFLIYYGFKNRKESGYQFVSGKKPPYTGKENTILITAHWDSTEQRAIPESIDFTTYDEADIPPGAHMHLLRNTGKHYYELYNIINDKGEQVDDKGKRIYKPVVMPDKKLITPEAYVIPSNMQPYKDYMEYNPPSAFQKIASGVLIIAMLVIGILMTMTTSKPPDQQGKVVKTSAYQLPQEINYDIVWQ